MNKHIIFLTPKDIAIKCGVTARYVRMIVNDIHQDYPDLIKNENTKWLISDTLLHLFKPKRNKSTHNLAITIDPPKGYKEDDLHTILEYIISKVSNKIEFNYTIENKKSNGKPHIHGYVKTHKNKRELVRLINEYLPESSYNFKHLYDLGSWKKYITKDGNKIKTLKK